MSPRGFLSDYPAMIGIIRMPSKAPLILGGSGYTVFPLEFFRALGADFGVAGEGERLSLLLDTLEQKENAASIPGVITSETSSVRYLPWKGELHRVFDPDAEYTKFYISYAVLFLIKNKR